MASTRASTISRLRDAAASGVSARVFANTNSNGEGWPNPLRNAA